MLINFIGNSIKFTSLGEIVILLEDFDENTISV
jgi:hypothetical protein